MKFFELNFAQMLVRYYLMMMVIILAGFAGQWWLAGLSFFIFLGAIMGVTFSKNNKIETGKLVKMDKPEQPEIRKAS